MSKRKSSSIKPSCVEYMDLYSFLEYRERVLVAQISVIKARIDSKTDELVGINKLKKEL